MIAWIILDQPEVIVHSSLPRNRSLQDTLKKGHACLVRKKHLCGSNCFGRYRLIYLNTGCSLCPDRQFAMIQVR